jgi:hypothetical protein
MEDDVVRQKHLFFDAEEYWKDKPFKKWVVRLATGSGKKEQSALYWVQARNEERAIAVAKSVCTVLNGRIRGTARLATPRDLGCSMS